MKRLLVTSGWVLSSILLCFSQFAMPSGEMKPMKEHSQAEAKTRAEAAIRTSALPFADNYTIEATDQKAEEKTWRFLRARGR